MHFAALFTTAIAALAQFAAAAPTGAAAPVSYRNHKHVRFTVETAEQAELLSALARSERVDVDAWTDIFPGAKADLRISPTAMSTLKTVFSRIKYEILSDDIQAGIDAERAESEAQAKAIQRASAGRSGFSAAAARLAPLPAAQLFAAYQDHSTLVDFIGSLPGYRRISIGKTYEQRDITGFVIGNGTRNIVFHGGIHAREWISPAVTTYIANFLASSDADAVALRRNFTFTVIPVLNVDGYAYTRSNDRLWRKNRQPNNGSRCIGTDPNRNFAYKWGGEGASTNPCDETYRGPAALTAPESIAITNYIKATPNVISYIDFHSYSQLWMFPYGYACNVNVPQPDFDDLTAAGKAGVNAVKAVNGIVFTDGPSCKTIYAASGSSNDQMYSLGVKYSYVIELRDTGRNGFTLPASQIVPSGQEMVKGVTAMWKFIANKA
ncbi:hypothetical protein BC831DRAFT_521687 [Entophlyctis helioformis]|nr:hypothetical protein BC831DRAFT_521687 [Entophlyctis helioformis]